MRYVLTLIALVFSFAPAVTAQVGTPEYEEHVARCEAGEAYACSFAAQHGQRGDNTFWYSEEQVRLRILGCTYGGDGSCWKFERIGTPNPYAPVRADRERFFPIVESGCANGSTMACWQVAEIFIERGDLVSAEARARSSCDGGFSDGCARLADVRTMRGLDASQATTLACYGRRPGYVRKQPYCQSRCDEGDGMACRELAEMFEWGRDNYTFTDRDVRQAERFYARACQLGDDESCR